MRRIVFAWVLAAALAGGLAGLALAAHPRARARAARAGPARVGHAAHVVRQRPSAAGSTCFVAIPYCSESPCVEFVAGGAQPAVVVGPGIRRAQPIRGCRGRGRRSGPASLPAISTPPQATPAVPARELPSP